MCNAVFTQLNVLSYLTSTQPTEIRQRLAKLGPPPLTNSEEMALSLNTGRPMAEGIPGGSSSEPVTPQDTSGFIECKRPTSIYIYIFFLYRLFFICIYFTFYSLRFLFFFLVPTDSDGNICLLGAPVITEPQAVVSSLLNKPLIMTSSIRKCTQQNANLHRTMRMMKPLLPQRGLQR